jgi:hypothetical protein
MEETGRCPTPVMGDLGQALLQKILKLAPKFKLFVLTIIPPITVQNIQYIPFPPSVTISKGSCTD